MTKTFPRAAGYDVPIEVVTPESFPRLTQCLLNRAYTENDIQKILGRNLLRIAEPVKKESTYSAMDLYDLPTPASAPAADQINQFADRPLPPGHC